MLLTRARTRHAQLPTFALRRSTSGACRLPYARRGERHDDKHEVRARPRFVRFFTYDQCGRYHHRWTGDSGQGLSEGQYFILNGRLPAHGPQSFEWYGVANWAPAFADVDGATVLLVPNAFQVRDEVENPEEAPPQR